MFDPSGKIRVLYFKLEDDVGDTGNHAYTQEGSEHICQTIDLRTLANATFDDSGVLQSFEISDDDREPAGERNGSNSRSTDGRSVVTYRGILTRGIVRVRATTNLMLEQQLEQQLRSTEEVRRMQELLMKSVSTYA